MRSIAAFAVFASLVLAPPQAGAQPGDEDFTETMRGFADMTSGQLIGGGEAADKVLHFGRDADGELVVRQIGVLALGGEWATEATPEGTVAVMRTRASTSSGNRGPEPADFQHAALTGLPVLIVGEWRTPPVVWELRAEGSGFRLREISASGSPGRWQMLGQ